MSGTFEKLLGNTEGKHDLLNGPVASTLLWGAAGFFYGYSVGTYMTAIPVFVYYITGLWKKRTNLL